jgi:hypothetical protein
MELKKRKTQSIIEYTALIIIVSTALSAVTYYVQRTLNVRARYLAEEMNEANR